MLSLLHSLDCETGICTRLTWLILMKVAVRSFYQNNVAVISIVEEIISKLISKTKFAANYRPYRLQVYTTDMERRSEKVIVWLKIGPAIDCTAIVPKQLCKVGLWEAIENVDILAFIMHVVTIRVI